MFNLIKTLFESYNFTCNELSTVVVLCQSQIRQEFWLIVKQDDIGSFLDNQSGLFDMCKTHCKEPALDKNISLLLLWDTGGMLQPEEMKRAIMDVEEEAYFFKKYVLYYSRTELEQLKAELYGNSLFDFLQTQIISENVFAAYKPISHKQNWQSLIYRIAMKLPFVKIDISSEELAPLSESNRIMLENHDLLRINDLVFEKIEHYTMESIQKLKNEELFNVLRPILGRQNSEN